MKQIERVVFREIKEPKKCIIGLTGRGQSAGDLLDILNVFKYKNLLTVAIQPEWYEWYPQPFSSLDQDEAVAGLPAARESILDIVKKIKDKFKIKSNKDISFLGYSAGGVMSNYVCLNNDNEAPYALSACCCGAILKTDDVPMKNKYNDTKYYLIHNRDDGCFDWFERYLPMKYALIENKYNIKLKEGNRGNHSFNKSDLKFIFDDLESLFNLNNDED